MRRFARNASDLEGAAGPAAYLVGREELVVLILDAADDAAARREIERQLPPPLAKAPWVRAGDRVAVWPEERRRAAEALFARGNARLRGAAADGRALGLGQDAPLLWLVAPTPWSDRAAAWLLARRKPVAITIVAVAAMGLFAGGRADRAADDAGLLRNAAARRDVIARTAGAVDRLPAFAGAAGAVPADVQLLELSCNGSERTLRLRGRAADFGAAARTRAALERDGVAMDAATGRAFRVTVGTASAVEFSLEARLP